MKFDRESGAEARYEGAFFREGVGFDGILDFVVEGMGVVGRVGYAVDKGEIIEEGFAKYCLGSHNPLSEKNASRLTKS